MTTTGSSTPKQRVGKRARITVKATAPEPRKSKNGDALYEMLNFQVPAPFVKGQKMHLRKCNLNDLENAFKMAKVVDGYTEKEIEFIRAASVSFNRGASRAIPVDEALPLIELEELLAEYRSISG